MRKGNHRAAIAGVPSECNGRGLLFGAQYCSSAVGSALSPNRSVVQLEPVESHQQVAVHKATVKRLVSVWSLSLDNQWGEQAQPLVKDGSWTKARFLLLPFRHRLRVT